MLDKDYAEVNIGISNRCVIDKYSDLGAKIIAITDSETIFHTLYVIGIPRTYDRILF